MKPAESDPAATVTELGTLRREALLESETLAPPLGAGCARVTVQAAEDFWPSVVGLQVSEDTCSGATRAMLAAVEAPLRVAVTVAV